MNFPEMPNLQGFFLLESLINKNASAIRNLILAVLLECNQRHSSYHFGGSDKYKGIISQFIYSAYSCCWFLHILPLTQLLILWFNNKIHRDMGFPKPIIRFLHIT